MRVARVFLAALSLAITIVATGCALAGAAAHKLVGPPDVKAKYELNKPTLVWAETFGNPTSTQHDAEQIATIVQRALEARPAPKESARSFVNGQPLRSLQALRPGEFRELTIPELGRRAGAEEVVYVHIVSSEVESPMGTAAVKATGTARVRVVDVASGQTVWPRDQQAGYELSAETPYARLGPGSNESTARQQLYRALGTEIARLFYSYKPDE